MSNITKITIIICIIGILFSLAGIVGIFDSQASLLSHLVSILCFIGILICGLNLESKTKSNHK